MRHSWTSFAASLALLCSNMFATAAEPVSSSDTYSIYQQYYERAVQAAPYDLSSPRVTLLLPGEPLLTAALNVAAAGDKVAEDASPGVVAQLASRVEGIPSEPQDADYDWYASQADVSPSTPVSSPASTEFEHNFAYGYEHEYDYGYEDFGYNPHLSSQSSAQEAAGQPAEENVAEVIAESTEDIEHLYGYDADGRPIRTAMSEAVVTEAVASEAVVAEESSDYTRGYSVYDDKLADEYLTKYHALLHGDEFATPAVTAPEAPEAPIASAPAQSLAAQLLEAAQAALAFDWREQALVLGQEALASDATQELLAQAHVAWQHLNSGESLSAVLDQGDYDYAALECEEACPSDIAPCHPLVVETEPVIAEPEVAEVNIDALLQVAHTLDRTGIALQQWSLTLSDWACQVEASRHLQARRSGPAEAR